MVLLGTRNDLPAGFGLLLHRLFFDLTSFIRHIMGFQQSRLAMKPNPETDLLRITGLGVQWPELLVGPESLQAYVEKWYDTSKPGLQKMLQVNKHSGIKTKAVIDLWDKPLWNQTEAPTIEALDEVFRVKGVELAVQACKKAIKEWGGSVDQITHVVAVTATNAGSPGYDQLVTNELGVPYSSERALLSGIGCAGGLAALRVGANYASAAAYRQKPACVLVFACELCSIQVRSELDYAQDREEPGIGPALFGDGAAALILCNEFAAGQHTGSIYSLLDWSTCLIPDTGMHMSYRTTTLGFLLYLSKQVPLLAASSVEAPLRKLLGRSTNQTTRPQDFDWALHPGGLSIIKGVQKAMALPEDRLRASYDIYQNRGNASSVAVLAVLDRLREMGPGRENVVACSFGPGLTVELATLKRGTRSL